MTTNLRKNTWIFQNGATALGDGSEMGINVGMVTATVEITGTGTNTVIFEGKASYDSAWYPILGVNLTDISTATSVSAKGVIYQIPLDGLTKFRIRVSAFTSGTVTVKGTVID